MLVRIKRQRDAESEPYWQSFFVDTEPTMTVSALLDRLNYTDDLYDAQGEPAPRIRWECSCLQKLCGSCAMLINGAPRLACAVFLRDLPEYELTLEPLSKFPVIADLMVDRSIIEEELKEAKAYLGAFELPRAKDIPRLYAVAKCLKCGLCLEACPNYVRGKRFFGALFANEMYLLALQSSDRMLDLRAEYADHFASGCSKALSCTDVCPAGIDTLSSMAAMNRLHPRRRRDDRA